MHFQCFVSSNSRTTATKKPFYRAGALAAALSLLTLPAVAATVGFSLRISTTLTPTGSFDAPGFTLTNLSDPGLRISSMLFTIGNPAFNFDSVSLLGAPAGGTAILGPGDTANGGARTDSFGIAFTSFDPNEVAIWRVEIDRDSLNSTTNFRTVFFNNGALVADSIVSVLFSDKRTLEMTLGGSTTAANYTFSGFEESAVIPLPAALPLLAGALGLLGFMRRRASA
jgi:hypothetical protein